LSIQEIDAELDIILGGGDVQKYWRLQKLKQEKQRKLKKLTF